MVREATERGKQQLGSSWVCCQAGSWELPGMAPSHPAPAVRCEPGVLGFTGASFVCCSGL